MEDPPSSPTAAEENHTNMIQEMVGMSYEDCRIIKESLGGTEDIVSLSVATDTDHPAAAPMKAGVDDEPTEDAVCRVCHCEGDEAQPLFHPCKCSGSIRFIHQDCLTSWLKFSKKSSCELCGETFGFRKVYAPDMPISLSWREIISEIWPTVAASMSSVYLILCHISFVWVTIPFLTFLQVKCCIYYLLDETLEADWYTFENLTDFFLMWFLGATVTVIFSFTSLAFISSIRYSRGILSPAELDGPSNNEIQPSADPNEIPRALIAGTYPPSDRALESVQSVDMETNESPIQLPQSVASVTVAAAANEPLNAESEKIADENETVELAPSFQPLDSASLDSRRSGMPRMRSPPLEVHSSFGSTADSCGLMSPSSRQPSHEGAISPVFDLVRLSTNDAEDDLRSLNYRVMFDSPLCSEPGAFDLTSIDLALASAAEPLQQPIVAPEGVLAIEGAEPTVEAAQPPLAEAMQEVDNDGDSSEDEEDVWSLLGPQRIPPREPQRQGQPLRRNAPVINRPPEQDVLIEIDPEQILLYFSTLPQSLNIFHLPNPYNILEWLVAMVPVLIAHAAILVLFLVIPTRLGGYIGTVFAKNPSIRDFMNAGYAIEIEEGSIKDLVTKTFMDFQKNEASPQDISHTVQLVLKCIEVIRHWMLGSAVFASTSLTLFIATSLFLFGTGFVRVPAHPFTSRNLRRLKRSMRRFHLISKIIADVCLEIVIVPHVTGCLIDLISLRTMGVNLNERISYCYDHPVTSSFLHTLIGFLFKTHVTTMLTPMSDIFTADFANSFLLNPKYVSLIQHYHEIEFEIFARRPWKDIAIRTLANLAFIVAFLFLMVLLPLRFGQIFVLEWKSITFNIEPIDYHVQIPLELIVFHVLIPILFEKLQYRVLMYDFTNAMLHGVGNLLGISDMILKPLAPPGEHIFQDVDIPAHLFEPNGGAVGDIQMLPDMLVLNNEIQERGDQLDSTTEAGIGAPREEYNVTASNTVSGHDGLELERGLPTPVVEELVSIDGQTGLDENDNIPTVEDDATVTPSPETENIADGYVENEIADSQMESISRPKFALRIFALVFLCSFIMFSVSSVFLFVPLVAGRELMGKLKLAAENDLYNLCAGYVVVSCVVAGARYISKDFGSSRSFWVLLESLSKYAIISSKVILIGGTWTGVVPLLVGLYCELVCIIPLHTAYNESARISIMHCWALGFVMTKVWMRCVIMGLFGDNVAWKRRFDRLLNEGIRRADFNFIFTELIIPIMTILLDYLLVPYFIGVSVGKISGLLEFEMSFQLQNLCVRFSYGVYALLNLINFIICVLWEYGKRKYNEIKDAKYLLARELTNR